MDIYDPHGPFVSHVGPGADAPLFNDIENSLVTLTKGPFRVVSATYDGGTDTITVTVAASPFSANFGAGNRVKFDVDQQLAITPVAINTTYWVFLNSDGQLTYSPVSDEEADGQAILASVATGATKDAIAVTDVRGMLPTPPPQDVVSTHDAIVYALVFGGS